MNNTHVIAVFLENRISMVYLLAFMYVFSNKRYRKGKTLFLLAVCYILTTVMDGLSFFLFQNDALTIPVAFVETLLVQGFGMSIHRKRDFKALFSGITAAAYVLLGNIAWNIADIYSDHWSFIFGIQIFTHTLVLLILRYGVRDLVQRQLIHVEKGWKMFCILPAAFYVLTYSLTVWPINIYEHPQVILAVVIELLLMIWEYLLMVRQLMEREKADERKVEQEYLRLYAKRIQQEEERMLKKEEEVAIIRHDLRHLIKLTYGYLTDGAYDKMKELLQQTDESLAATRPERFCQNLSVNVVASYCSLLAEKNNVSLEMNLQIPATLHCNEYEYATVVSNLLENAIEAAATVKDAQNRIVRAKAQQIKNQLVLEISNYFQEKQHISEDTELPLTKKGTGHGLGMKSVKAFAEKQDAVFDYSIKGNLFYIKLIVF